MLERQDEVNWSTLKHMLVSPKHYRWSLAHPREDTEALQLGRLVHAMVYEPDAVSERYIKTPNFHRGMNDATAIAKGYDGGKQAAASFDYAGREGIDPEMFDTAASCAAALHADPLSGPMIVGGYSEQLIRWTDRETGIECRGRIDHLNGRLSDLKTTRTVDRRMFASQAARLGYIGQIAFYADGLAANGISLAESPAWIVVENVAPFDVVVLEIPDNVVAAGRRLYRACLDRLAECRALDRWPGVSGGLRSLFVMPAWAGAQEEEVELIVGGETVAL